MLDVVALDDNSRVIGFADWLRGRKTVQFENVVERSSNPLAICLFGIRFAFFIDHLIFMTQCRVAGLGHKIFHAAVSFWTEFPFPLQFKIIEFHVSDNISPAFSETMKPAVL